MFKAKLGTISNPEGTESREVIAKMGRVKPPKKKLALGVGLITSGVLMLMDAAFMSGAWGAEAADYDALDSLGLLTPTEKK